MKAFPIAFIVLALSACSPEVTHRAKPDLVIDTVLVPEPNSQLERRLPGLVVGADQTLLSFRVEGRIEQMLVKEGQKVKAGEVLAKLDDTKRRHKLNEAMANRRLAENQWSRAKELYKKAMVSDAELDRAKANFALQKSNEDLAKRQQAYTTLIAPVDGVIAQSFTESREFVTPGTPVLAMYRSDRLDVELTVSDTLLTQINQDFTQRDFEVELISGQSKQTIQMRYLQHTFQPDPETSNYKLWLTAEGLDFAVVPGTSALVTLNEANGAGTAYIVPSTALDGQQEKYRVWEVRDNVTYPVDVKVLDIRATGVLLDAPLTPGALLANSDLRKLSEGKKVVGNAE